MAHRPFRRTAFLASVAALTATSTFVFFGFSKRAVAEPPNDLWPVAADEIDEIIDGKDRDLLIEAMEQIPPEDREQVVVLTYDGSVLANRVKLLYGWKKEILVKDPLTFDIVPVDDGTTGTTVDDETLDPTNAENPGSSGGSGGGTSGGSTGGTSGGTSGGSSGGTSGGTTGGSSGGTSGGATGGSSGGSTGGTTGGSTGGSSGGSSGGSTGGTTGGTSGGSSGGTSSGNGGVLPPQPTPGPEECESCGLDGMVPFVSPNLGTEAPSVTGPFLKYRTKRGRQITGLHANVMLPKREIEFPAPTKVLRSYNLVHDSDFLTHPTSGNG